eukprot:gb/GEZN01003825.1/.p1 GENE.gb/GEZN01003825.1/~~gb/GEZN01003825.1/.p1  ORF type:complete len:221 (+),score=37.54 gb/GEZN01003825.1/:25-663(+)
MKRLGVIGTTGGTGLATVRAFLDQGKDRSVKCLVRDPQKLPEDLRENKSVTVVVGDAMDAKKVADVVTDVDAVVVSLGSTKTNPKICSEAQPVINKALNASNPNARMVVVSSLGVGSSYEHCSFLTKIFVNLMISGPVADKCIQEAAVEKDIKNYVLVRPGGLQNTPGTGKWLAAPDVSGGMIPREDVAKFIVQEALGTDKWKNKGVTVVGA